MLDPFPEHDAVRPGRSPVKIAKIKIAENAE